jgi:hypothetical protein
MAAEAQALAALAAALQDLVAALVLEGARQTPRANVVRPLRIA